MAEVTGGEPGGRVSANGFGVCFEINRKDAIFPASPGDLHKPAVARLGAQKAYQRSGGNCRQASISGIGGVFNSDKLVEQPIHIQIHVQFL